MVNKFASLCILSYKRPQMLIDCLESLLATVDYPAEIIVNDDSGLNNHLLHQLLTDGKISKLITSAGNNRGVGRSFQNCIGVSEGGYIFKLDTDLIFKPHWLSTAVKILENNDDVGAVSLFNYSHYDPADQRFKILLERKDSYIVSDFVSSSYGFRRYDLNRSEIRNIPDDGMHKGFGSMAITKQDYIENFGFGKNSVYITFDSKGVPRKTITYDQPLLFGLD